MICLGSCLAAAPHQLVVQAGVLTRVLALNMLLMWRLCGGLLPSHPPSWEPSWEPNFQPGGNLRGVHTRVPRIAWGALFLTRAGRCKLSAYWAQQIDKYCPGHLGRLSLQPDASC